MKHYQWSGVNGEYPVAMYNRMSVREQDTLGQLRLSAISEKMGLRRDMSIERWEAATVLEEN